MKKSKAEKGDPYLVSNLCPHPRWCYWLNVIVCGLSIVLLAIFYFPPSFQMINEEVTRMQELRSLDYGGLFLYCLGLVLLLLGFSKPPLPAIYSQYFLKLTLTLSPKAWSQGHYSWGDAHVLGPIISGAAVVAGFFLYRKCILRSNGCRFLNQAANQLNSEIYFPLSQPLMPMRLLKIRNFAAVVVVGVVGQMVYYAMNLLWPKMITVYFTTDNVKIGLMSVSISASCYPSSFLHTSGALSLV